MRYILATIIAVATFVSCSGTQKRSTTPQVVEPTFYTYHIVAEYPHSRTSYTQGLQFVEGELWEGTGEYGKSRLLRTELATGKILESKSISQYEFGEGITLLGNKIYQLTWLDGKMYIYDRQTLQLLNTHQYKGEGWGLTTDGEWLYLSDGSDKIFKVNPETLRNESFISIKRAGEAVDFLNELEWIDGRIWANIYLSDEVVVINPVTGVVEAVIDFQGLLPESERTPETDVLNGIAYDAEQGRILLTGKCWSKIYHIEVVK
jgi:glutamine cyclotransferase